jgi:hypothetical protein
MKVIKAIAICLFFVSLANAYPKIADYNQDVKFTNEGRTVKVKVRMVELDIKDEYKANWAYTFGPQFNVELIEARVLNKEFTTNFKNNVLTFDFIKPQDDREIVFEFSYKQKPDKATPYDRQEFVSIDSFLEGANAVLTVEVPPALAVYSSNEKFTRNNNVYRWEGLLTSQGFSDTFWLTLKKAQWRVGIIYGFQAKSPFNEVALRLPAYLKNGGYRIEQYNMLSNLPSNALASTANNSNVNFLVQGANAKNVQLGIEAVIVNDFDNKFWMQLKPENALAVDDALQLKLQPLISAIQFNDPNDGSPLYIKLAKWTHNAIKYDLSYSGKKMTTEEILNTGAGVCEHYAQVYNDLLRSAGIPSMMLAGMSFDYNTGNFASGGHAWNLVYINNQWIPIDSTWGIYSGKLPISHIFFNFYEKDQWEFQFSYKLANGSNEVPKIDVKRFVEFLK